MATAVLDNLRMLVRNGLGTPILLMALLAMMIVPLPPLALDMLFTFNITLSLVVMLVAVYTPRPLEFAVFPTVLLIATLLRLALNIASTRVILLEGHTGTDAAGNVIQAFGDFVVGGNYAVGLVVFGILVIINFVVVTKGAGRISEVTARFTLDALPGKQMAIDADLNAGLIDSETAKKRREEVAQEADFYGSMDGASKFVRGDAIAGILILFINIIGGLFIGILQHGMPFQSAMNNYTLLTIGDGLVAQIPSLVLSTGTAILVTRVSSSQDMAGEVVRQLLGNPKALAVSAAVLGIMGLVPGMPNLAFLTLAAIAGFFAWRIHNNPPVEETVETSAAPRRAGPAGRAAAGSGGDGQAPVATQGGDNQELTWDDVPPVDTVGLEVGYGLIPLVDRNQGGQLLNRIKGVRKKVSQDLGFLVPSVHIRDNLDLGPNSYRVSVLGVPMAEAELQPSREMAINPGSVSGEVKGQAARDPAFGLDAVWIEPSQRDLAQSHGYTVVDASTVAATHLSQIIQSHAHELLGHEEVQKLLDILARKQPKLVEELVPNTLPLSTVVRVLQNLLEERIPIRDMRTIVETLAEHGQAIKDPSALTARVREALGRMIVQNVAGMSDELPVITLDPQLEQLLLSSVQGNGDGTAGLEPGLADRLQRSLADSAQRQEVANQPAVLLTAPQLRSWISRLTRHNIEGLNVLSYNEVPDEKRVKIVASIGQQQVAQGS
ncbi:flagellar biosynthesis protein FlhA [Aquisalimonas asiatica]|uniref:Flagellar biosynthesis protein FlhA n=1 Tax=Aquisalimonas asiatica TaxID=406100 RepID=A0A1H8QS64_9GAMM|nr:flagellar biosynthesis protein FlhA [Aquisalimonas asiatica]SEO57100.1 flagellar biosynthesis protein FlhA [Aquisalimonas asiatica]